MVVAFAALFWVAWHGVQDVVRGLALDAALYITTVIINQLFDHFKLHLGIIKHDRTTQSSLLFPLSLPPFMFYE